MSIQSILDHKGSKVITITPDTKVGTAAHRLRLEHIGAIVITGEDRHIEGILPERDKAGLRTWSWRRTCSATTPWPTSRPAYSIVESTITFVTFDGQPAPP